MKIKRLSSVCVTASLLAAACVAVAGCGNSRPHVAPISDDQYCERALVINRSKAEALSWMQTKDGRERTLGGDVNVLSAADSLQFVKQLYQYSAVKVTAIDIQNDAVSSTTETLIVELPAQKTDRAKILNIENDVSRQNGFDIEPDTGQHYAMIHW